MHQIRTRTYPIHTYLTVLTIALILLIVASLTLFAAWNASRIQKENSIRELTQTVKQGTTALKTYLEAQQANLDLWTSQPIVDVFFSSPELAVMSVPGLRGFFNRVRARDASIATVLFVSGGKIVFDAVGLAVIIGAAGAMAISKWLSQPLAILVENIRQIELNHLDDLPVQRGQSRVAEVSILHEAYSTMIGKMIASRKEIQEKNNELKQSEERFRVLFENNPAALLLCDFTDVRHHLEKSSLVQAGEMDSFLEAYPEVIERCAAAIRLLAVNSSALELFKARDPEELKAKLQANLTSSASDAYRELLAGFWKEETPIIRDAAIEAVEGDRRFVTLTCAVIPRDEAAPAPILICINDITKRQKLEEQLRQSQKLESVGRLAGGVAHDYNNMLSVILGYSDLAMLKIGPQDTIREDLEEIQTAAQRSVDITRQLLAFARKQTIAPKVIDLNETVENMLSMLKRLIGENLDLAWRPKQGLWPVEMDPSQIDQILANLCVNARDAISGNGKITIETNIRTFNQDYCRMHRGFIPGDFVMLAVSDNGEGMDRQTQEQIFEPFFTTKNAGQGTGLGLSTIFGIVKQNKGFINVYSEPGKGTTFRLYFPSYKGEKVAVVPQQVDRIPKGGGEQLLLVEDEVSTLKMISRMLTGLGYQVLSAHTPTEAVRLAKENHNNIALLMTDVVMPEMNGRDLTAQIAAFCPGIQTLFMSGYTANVIAHHGILNEGIHFIQKPFSKEELAAKVETALRECQAQASDSLL